LRYVEVAVPGPAPPRPLDVAVTGDGSVWVMSGDAWSPSTDDVYPKDLRRLSGGRWTTYRLPGYRAGVDVGFRTLVAAPDNALWTGTASGFARFDGGSWIVPARTYAGGDLLVAGADGRMWTRDPVDSGTLQRFDGRRWQSVVSGGPATPSVLAVTTDGSVWAAGPSDSDSGEPAGGPLEHYNGTTWTTLTQAGGLTVLGADALASGPRNTLWAVLRYRLPTGVGQGRALTRFDGAHWSTVATAVTFSSWAWNKTLVAESDQAVWLAQSVGASGTAVCRLAVTGVDDCLTVSDRPATFALDQHRRLWVADTRRLAVYAPRT
jgi:hypothetical protein